MGGDVAYQRVGGWTYFEFTLPKARMELVSAVPGSRAGVGEQSQTLEDVIG